jgi:hypothetical protein
MLQIHSQNLTSRGEDELKSLNNSNNNNDSANSSSLSTSSESPPPSTPSFSSSSQSSTSPSPSLTTSSLPTLNNSKFNGHNTTNLDFLQNIKREMNFMNEEEFKINLLNNSRHFFMNQHNQHQITPNYNTQQSQFHHQQQQHFNNPHLSFQHHLQQQQQQQHQQQFNHTFFNQQQQQHQLNHQLMNNAYLQQQQQQQHILQQRNFTPFNNHPNNLISNVNNKFQFAQQHQNLMQKPQGQFNEIVPIMS